MPYYNFHSYLQSISFVSSISKAIKESKVKFAAQSKHFNFFSRARKVTLMGYFHVKSINFHILLLLIMHHNTSKCYQNRNMYVVTSRMKFSKRDKNCFRIAQIRTSWPLFCKILKKKSTDIY